MQRGNKKYYRSRKRPILKRRGFWYIILIIIFVGGFSYFLFKTPYFEVKNIEVVGGEEKIIEEVKKMIENKNFFLLNATQISAKISKTFPNVKEIVIKRHFPNTVSAQVIERQALAVFCPQYESTSCFLISKEGIIFNPSERRDDLMLVFSSLPGEVKLGDKVIEKELMEDIVLISQNLNSQQMIIKEIEISSSGIKAKTAQGFFIYFSKLLPMEDQIEILLTALQKKISAEEQKNLQYIDLRGLKENQRGVIYWQ